MTTHVRSYIYICDGYITLKPN